MTPEQNRAQALAYRTYEASRRDRLKLLDLVDSNGVATVKKWLQNIEESLTPSPGTRTDPRR